MALIHAGASTEQVGTLTSILFAYCAHTLLLIISQVTTLGITPATMAEAKGHSHVLALLTPEKPEVRERVR